MSGHSARERAVKPRNRTTPWIERSIYWGILNYYGYLSGERTADGRESLAHFEKGQVASGKRSFASQNSLGTSVEPECVTALCE